MITAVYPPEDYKRKLLKEYDENTGIEKLRLLVSNANYCNESFNEQFTIEELIKIHRALALCAWDILPDSWTERQIREALELGRVPTWDEQERPTYDDPPPARVYLSAGRKEWNHNLPFGWKEEAFERFTYIECGVFSKPIAELTDEDRELIEWAGKPGEGFIMPAGAR